MSLSCYRLRVRLCSTLVEDEWSICRLSFLALPIYWFELFPLLLALIWLQSILLCLLLGLLGRPPSHDVGGLPPASLAPEDVLVVVAGGVNQGAVATACIGVPLGKVGELRAPLEKREGVVHADGVVGVRSWAAVERGFEWVERWGRAAVGGRREEGGEEEGSD
ncbi:hypothetical protein Acr_17g0006470 [Actinidia rufa]|uniref:Uncharacterized protein n=1 Tax=Actinidia rufa TaxID=165716 RepID=A0A7J0G2R1_9ERIC|nr:hypothetical protein Acr_17g0006470 [Actinidia rufa]